MENGDYKNDPMKRLVYKHDVIVELNMNIDEPIDFVEALKNVPVVDAVEVVRCKDCKFWDSDCIWCDLWGNTQEYGNGFCSYGERKDDE